MAHLAHETAAEILEDENRVTQSVTLLVGDDFSEFSSVVPGVHAFIGSRNKTKGTDFPHHHPKFNIDEDCLPIGAEMHVRMALKFLGA